MNFFKICNDDGKNLVLKMSDITKTPEKFDKVILKFNNVTITELETDEEYREKRRNA